jgi:c-di-GMP-binding flagellar brake protein YcgR
MPAANNLEKRMDNRATINEDAKYKILSETDPGSGLIYQTAKTKNISKGGVCISIPHKISEGNVLRVELPALSGAERPIKAFCEVQWCRKENEENFEVGLSFIALKEEDVEFLTEYVASQQRAM